jgi:hypothetical protein
VYKRVCVYGSKQLCLDLENNFNIVSRKSLFLEPPILDTECAKAYIRGYIDGDGYLGYRKNAFEFNVLGTYNVCLWIQVTLDIQGKIYAAGNVCWLYVRGNEVLKLNAICNPELQLQRKWKVFDEIR